MPSSSTTKDVGRATARTSLTQRNLVDQRGGVPVQNIQDDGLGVIPIGKAPNAVGANTSASPRPARGSAHPRRALGRQSTTARRRRKPSPSHARRQAAGRVGAPGIAVDRGEWHVLAVGALSVFALELAESLRHGRMLTRRAQAVSRPASTPLIRSSPSHTQCATSTMPRPAAAGWSPPTRYRVRSSSW
jgi:hypothetical protein